MFARSSFNWAPLTDITTEQREQFFDLFYQGMDALQKARDDAVAEVKRPLHIPAHLYLDISSAYTDHG